MHLCRDLQGGKKTGPDVRARVGWNKEHCTWEDNLIIHGIGSFMSR